MPTLTPTLPPILLVALGGGTGAVLRWLVTLGLTRALGLAFPYGTLAVNLAGGLVIGALAHLLPLLGTHQHPARLLLITGVLGGFTTFSAFSLETFAMIERGDWGLAVLYGGLSVVGAITAVGLGMTLARWILP